jgi:hypothetical protein
MVASCKHPVSYGLGLLLQLCIPKIIPSETIPNMIQEKYCFSKELFFSHMMISIKSANNELHVHGIPDKLPCFCEERENISLAARQC